MRHVPELDSIRGVGALWILAFHLWPVTFGAGFSAVDLFFVLSGFLISTIILKERHHPGFTLRFYARRGLRIWPIYYLCLLGMCALSAGLNLRLRDPIALDALPYYLTYTQNIQFYWFGKPPLLSFFPHGWTLAVEEQFYLIWPLLIALVGPRRVIPLALSLVALAMTARGLGFAESILIGRCDGLALGALLAALLIDDEAAALRRRGLVRLFVASAAVAAAYFAAGSIAMGTTKFTSIMVHGPGAIYNFMFVLLYFGVMGLVVVHSGHPALGPLRARPLRYVGKISYGLYLYHVPINFLLHALMSKLGYGWPWWIKPFALALAFAAAILSWTYIERPILTLKRHFDYRPEGTSDTDSPPAPRHEPEPVNVALS